MAATAIPSAASAAPVKHKYYQRFDRIDRVMHALLMLTFTGCTITGMPLVFSDHAWAVGVAKYLGGFTGTALIHRVCAVIMIVVFVGHVVRVFSYAIRTTGLMGALWGPKSMVPQPQDGIDAYRHVLWFIGKGPRPTFDRYTYWEKFDYWAVFWGMFIIGGSGLMLWFPTAFSEVVPGWVFNIATVVHGEEALLAVGFIFTIHFFNGHVRPEKFPMDLVIFTGRIPEHELKDERTKEYARLVAEGGLVAIEATPPSPFAKYFGWIVGGTVVVVGTVTILVIVFSVIQ